jgi:hypothetical protein
MLHLISDSRGFFYNRMSPALRTATEYITGRDDKGVKRDVLEQAKDLAKMPIPISMKSKLGQRWWEAFLNSFGVQEQRWDSIQTIEQKAADFKKKNNLTSPIDVTYDQEKDVFAALRSAIENSQPDRAKQEYAKLKATVPTDKIQKHFKTSLTHPFTGSKTGDQKFFNSLDEAGKMEFKEAKDLRQARLRMIESLR